MGDAAEHEAEAEDEEREEGVGGVDAGGDEAADEAEGAAGPEGFVAEGAAQGGDFAVAVPVELEADVVQGGAVDEGAEEADAAAEGEPEGDDVAEEDVPAEAAAFAELVAQGGGDDVFDGAAEEAYGFGGFFVAEFEVARGEQAEAALREPGGEVFDGFADAADVVGADDEGVGHGETDAGAGGEVAGRQDRRSAHQCRTA